MIFALIDYLKYQFQKGQYSRANLERDGWFFADKSSVGMLDSVRNGDMLFCQPIGSFTSWVVMYFQGGPCSHVGTLTENKTVLEAITTGVTERPASAYFDGKHFLAIRRHPGITTEQEQQVVGFLRDQI